MKKSLIAWFFTAALLLSLTGCGNVSTAKNEPPTPAPTVTTEVPVPTAVPEPSAAPAPTPKPVRQDGERFETVITLEGMEETVSYEHIRNDSLGIEMDYDYNNFVRYSEPGRERFISDWDDPENPENYLELISSPGDADSVAAFIREKLSEEYDLTELIQNFDGVGDCIRIEASVIKGTNRMAEHLQTVYIIPAPDGCRIATVHSFIAESEGFGHHFSYMLNTLSLIDGNGEGALSDEQALSAIRKYCISVNPDLANITNAGEYPTYWEITSSDAREIVVLFRSYTGAQTRYYIDRNTGDTYVTEFVPGITAEEVRTEDSLNVRDYLG